ncbi:hypothetical protein NTCA1_41400 [Novosphingobium sp. TCA1]|nr:hypothetical protein NTCA1_41400 [Novosphingobium sp. TCA1]
MGANISLKDLTEFARRDANLLVICSNCDHKGVLDAAKVCRYYLCRGWNTTTSIAHLHLRCQVCGRRPTQIRPTPDKPDRPQWMAYQTDWTQLTRKLRG